jgi:hypothetical protein
MQAALKPAKWDPKHDEESKSKWQLLVTQIGAGSGC